MNKVLEALQEARDYFAARMDADVEPGGHTIPNEEMKLVVALDEAIAEAKGATGAVKDLMTAYERMVRSQYPDQIEQKPWRCAEYCAAEYVVKEHQAK